MSELASSPSSAAPEPTDAMFVAVDVTRPRRRRRRSRWYWLAYVILVPSAILFVAPFAWLISASFQTIGDMFSWPPQWIPDNPSLVGYKKFLGIGPQIKDDSPEAWRWFANSAFVAISVTALQLFFNSLAAYVFAKREFPGKNAIFLLFLATMMIPGQITLIPNYLVIKHIPLFGGNDIFGQGGSSWLDSYWGLILPGGPDRWGERVLDLLPDRTAAVRAGAGRHRHLHLHRGRGGLLLAADHCQQPGQVHRPPRAGPVRSRETDPVGRAVRRVGARHPADDRGLHDRFEALLNESGGVLRLEPAWVARDFLPAGRRLGLPEDEYDAGERGAICERWLASTTPADNRVKVPDEGLSAIHADGPRLPFHIHPPSAYAARVDRHSKDEAYHFLPGVDPGAHPETLLGVHPHIAAGPRGESLLPYLQDWDSDLILTTTRAYLQVPGHRAGGRGGLGPAGVDLLRQREVQWAADRGGSRTDRDHHRTRRLQRLRLVRDGHLGRNGAGRWPGRGRRAAGQQR